MQSVVAVGHSAGALVGMELTQLQPRRVAGAFCQAPSPSTPIASLLLPLLVLPLGMAAAAAGCHYTPAIMAFAGLGFVAPALPTTPENSFTRRANLGQQLRFLLTRGLLADDTLGLRYVRRQILRRRDEVAAGKMGLHADESEVPQVGSAGVVPGAGGQLPPLQLPALPLPSHLAAPTARLPTPGCLLPLPCC